jgi:hypothetical protein
MVASSKNLANFATRTTSTAIATNSNAFVPIRNSGSIGGNLKDIVLETVSAVIPVFASASASAFVAPFTSTSVTARQSLSAVKNNNTTAIATPIFNLKQRAPRRQKMASIGVEAMRMMQDSTPSSPSSTGTGTGTDTMRTMRAIPLTPVPLLYPITSIATALNQEQLKRKSHFAQYKLFQKTCPNGVEVFKTMNKFMLSAPMMPDLFDYNNSPSSSTGTVLDRKTTTTNTIPTKNENKIIMTTKAQKKQEEHEHEVHLLVGRKLRQIKRRLFLELALSPSSSPGQEQGQGEEGSELTTTTNTTTTTGVSSSSSSSSSPSPSPSPPPLTLSSPPSYLQLLKKCDCFDEDDDDDDESTTYKTMMNEDGYGDDDEDLDWGTFISFDEDENYDHKYDCSSSPSLNNIFRHPGFLHHGGATGVGSDGGGGGHQHQHQHQHWTK